MKPCFLIADAIGDGVIRACQSVLKAGKGVGCVVGTFSSGFYVQVEDMLFAVGGPTIPTGPLHLVLKTFPPLPVEQSDVQFASDRIWTETSIITLASASRYQPVQPTPERLDVITPILARLNVRDNIPHDIIHVWPLVENALKRADLKEAGKQIQGLGEGLTPTGDDVLAGLLLFAHWTDPGSPTPARIAQQVTTSQLSKCFLEWAAVGQNIQPVHDLLEAAFQVATIADCSKVGAVEQRLKHTIDVVTSIGHSSGQGILSGLGLAAAMKISNRLSMVT